MWRMEMQFLLERHGFHDPPPVWDKIWAGWQACDGEPSSPDMVNYSKISD
jgi:hypothetical protein